jgi:Lipopolysaccharide-assembly
MNTRQRTGSALGACILAAGIGASCGYALVGKGITSDPSIKRIGVPLFKDTTGRAGLDQKVTHKVVEELLRRGRFDVVPDTLHLDQKITLKVIEELQKRGRFTVVQEETGVDAVVDGEVTGYFVSPVSFSGAPGQSQASRYAVTVTAKVTYRKFGVKEPIWANEGFSFRDEYDIGDTSTSYFDREDQSIDRIAIGFARSLVAAMLEAF